MSERVCNPTPPEAMAPPPHQDAGEQARFLWLPVTEIRPYDHNPRTAALGRPKEASVTPTGELRIPPDEPLD